MVNRNHKDLIVTESADVRKVLQDADYVVTTLRVGGDHSRVMDETIALNAGVIGQETTGVGGFSMAVRTIPILLEYCRLINEIAPNAWIFNFTNPSGLVTQALKSAGYEKVIGICDAPSSTKFRMAAKLGVDEKRPVCGILRIKSSFLDSQREDQGRGDSAQAPCGRRIFKEHSGIFHVRSRFVADDRIFAERISLLLLSSGKSARQYLKIRRDQRSDDRAGQQADDGRVKGDGYGRRSRRRTADFPVLYAGS